MAENIDSVAVFYEDGSYRHQPWEDLGPLEVGELRYVVLAVYHMQRPAGLPGLVSFTGDAENIAVKLDGIGLKVHSVQQPPGQQENARSSTFRKGGDQQEINAALPAPAYAAMTAMAVSWYTMPYGAEFDALQARANDKALELRAGPVPDSGTY